MASIIKELPKPAGKFKVGVTHQSFIDENRIDPFPLAKGKNREIPCVIWYPNDSADGYQNKPFLSTSALDAIKEYGMYKAFSKKLCEIKTNSYIDAPISTQQTKFPVVLFNFGFSSFMEQSSIQMENLASHGYVVISIGHPYDGAVTYPDGRALGIDKQAIRDLKKAQTKKGIKELRTIMAKLQEPLPTDEIEKLTRKMFGTGAMMEKKIEVWIDDIRFIAKIVEKLNSGEISSIFKNKLLLENGIGSFGHSYGGASSILAAAADNKISCAINQDGGMYGGFSHNYQFAKPFMFMESEESHGMSQYFYDANRADTIMLHIKDTKHHDYSDFTLIHRPLLFKLMKTFGKVDGKKMVGFNCQYVLAFFDKYLLGINNPLLEKITISGSCAEIQICIILEEKIIKKKQENKHGKH